MQKSILFSADHLIALAVSVGTAVLVVQAARKDPARSQKIRRALSYLLPLLIVLWPLESMFVQGTQAVWAFLPLDLCTFNLLVTVAALFTLRQGLFECSYFWSVGAFLAMVTPNLSVGFPALRFLMFFALHGLLVASWAYLVWGVRMRPRKHAWLRVWGWTHVFAALVAVVDLLFERNYFFLMRRPANATLLDAFGPWPVYLVTVDLTLGALFFLMYVVGRRLAPDRAAESAPPAAAEREPVLR